MLIIRIPPHSVQNLTILRDPFIRCCHQRLSQRTFTGYFQLRFVERDRNRRQSSWVIYTMKTYSRLKDSFCIFSFLFFVHVAFSIWCSRFRATMSRFHNTTVVSESGRERKRKPLSFSLSLSFSLTPAATNLQWQRLHDDAPCCYGTAKNQPRQPMARRRQTHSLGCTRRRTPENVGHYSLREKEKYT